VQVLQGVCRDAGRSQDHAAANPGVEHPLRQYRYDAWFDLDMYYGAASTLLAVPHEQSTPVERVPAIVDFNFSPDMGRMNLRWWLVATTGFFMGATKADEPEPY